MRRGYYTISAVVSAAGLLLIAGDLSAQTSTTNDLQVIDLAATLRLAGAQNLDVQIASERLTEAQANSQISLWQFFPWIAPGVSYRRHDNLTQNVEGDVIDVHKQSYAIGPAITAQVDLGNAIYNKLVARQLVKAAAEGLESSRAENITQAAQGYFDLLKADAAVGIATDAAKITGDYLKQVRQAVEAGIAYRGDVLRVEVQAERNQVALRRAEQQRRIASARLVQVLHLDPAVELAPNAKELAPVSLFPADTTLRSLLAQAQTSRPELRENQALASAAEASVKGSRYGPLIPTLGAYAFAGGLGGGRDGASDQFGGSQDYQVGLSWRIGPGGLFDRGRIRLAESRLRSTTLTGQKLADEISRQVVENHAIARSLSSQLSSAQNAARFAAQSLRLSQDRQTFAVGNVLEAILSEQELTSARLELAGAITDYNKAQYGLAHAIGGSKTSGSPALIP